MLNQNCTGAGFAVYELRNPEREVPCSRFEDLRSLSSMEMHCLSMKG